MRLKRCGVIETSSRALSEDATSRPFSCRVGLQLSPMKICYAVLRPRITRFLSQTALTLPKRQFIPSSCPLRVDCYSPLTMSGKQATLKYVKPAQQTIGCGSAITDFIWDNFANRSLANSLADPMAQKRLLSSRGLLSPRRQTRSLQRQTRTKRITERKPMASMRIWI